MNWIKSKLQKLSSCELGFVEHPKGDAVSKVRDAAVEIHEWLVAHNIQHFFIGGLAVQFWGRPRATVDVDICAVIPPEAIDRAVELLLASFRPRVPDPLNFAAQHGVLLLSASNDCGIDISLSGLWFDSEAVVRTSDLEVAPGKRLPICSAEDLIVMKSVAGRARDEDDLKVIIQLERNRLDVELIRRLLKEYAALTDEDEPAQRFERFWRRYGEQGTESSDV